MPWLPRIRSSGLSLPSRAFPSSASSRVPSLLARRSKAASTDLLSRSLFLVPATVVRHGESTLISSVSSLVSHLFAEHEADHSIPIFVALFPPPFSPKPSLSPKRSPSTCTTPPRPTRLSSSGNRSRSTPSEDWEPRRSFIRSWSCSSTRTRRS